MKRARPVITGLGVLSPMGNGREAFFRSVTDGRCGLRPLAGIDLEGIPCRLGGLVEGFDFRDHVKTRNKRTKKMDEISRRVVAAASMALADAGIVDEAGQVREGLADGFGVVTGSAFGSLSSIWRHYGQLLDDGPDGVDPKVFPNTSLNVPAAQVAIEFALKGPLINLASGPVAGLEAISTASLLLEVGRAKRILVGGYEELTPALLRALSRLGVLSPSQGDGEEGSHPFGSEANGLVAAEGACFLLLETEEAAKARGAEIHGRIMGCASAAVPLPVRHQVCEEAGVAAIEGALAVSAIDGSSLAGVVSGASGACAGNDALEAASVGEALSASRGGPVLFPLKALTGETFGAFGPMGVAAALSSFRERPVPDGGIAYERHEAVYLDLGGLPGGTALVFHSAPGGHACALIVSDGRG